MTRAVTPGRLLAQVLAAIGPRDVALAGLDQLSSDGDNTARHFAAQLRGIRPAGRKRIDDSALLAEMAALRADGVPERKLASLVAKGDPTVAQRLRERRRQKI